MRSCVGSPAQTSLRLADSAYSDGRFDDAASHADAAIQSLEAEFVGTSTSSSEVSERGVIVGTLESRQLLSGYGILVRSYLRLQEPEAAKAAARRAVQLQESGIIEANMGVLGMKGGWLAGDKAMSKRGLPDVPRVGRGPAKVAAGAQQMTDRPRPRPSNLERLQCGKTDAQIYRSTGKVDLEITHSLRALELDEMDARVEGEIAKAMESGVFDNLEGKGKPLRSGERDVVADLFKKNDVLPEFLDKLRTIRQELEGHTRAVEDAWFNGSGEPTASFVKQKDNLRVAMKALNFRIQLVNATAPAAAQAPLLDFQAEVRQAKQRGEERVAKVRENAGTAKNSSRRSLWSRVAGALRRGK